jgi:hypothetical protein
VFLQFGQMSPCLLGHPSFFLSGSRQCEQRVFPPRKRSLSVRAFALAIIITLCKSLICGFGVVGRMRWMLISQLSGTLRLIQGGVIDLVKHLLSCNDQSPIKIAE